MKSNILQKARWLVTTLLNKVKTYLDISRYRPVSVPYVSRVCLLTILCLMVGVGNAWGTDVAVNDVLIIENFTGGDTGSNFGNANTSYSSTYSSITTKVSGDASSVTISGSNAKIFNPSSVPANMDGAHAWLNKNTEGYIEIDNIPLHNVTKFQAHWGANNSPSVTFYYKFNGETTWSNGGSANKSADATSNVITVTSGKTSVSIKFQRENNTTNQRIDKLSLVVTEIASGSTPSLTADPTSLSWGTNVLQGSTPATKTVSISGSNLTSGTLTISANNGYSVSPSSISVNGTLSATDLTITPPSTSTTGAKNGTLTISGGGLASNVTVSLSMTVVTAYAVNWFVNGQSYTTGSPTRFVASGGTIETFPTPPSSCDNTKVFVGWSETNIGSTETNTAPTLITTATTISAAKNYYAVFAKRGDFTRITGPSSLTANMQLVIVSNKFSTAITNADTPGYATAPTESSSKVTPTDAMIWLLTGSASGWRISAPNGKLLGYASNPSSNNSTTATLAANNTLSTWKIGQSSYTSDVLYISNYTTNTCALEAGSASSAWVVYNASTYSSNQYCALKVYGASFTKYITQCCTELGSINGSIKLAYILQGYKVL